MHALKPITSFSTIELRNKEDSSRRGDAMKEPIQTNEGMSTEQEAQAQLTPLHFIGTSFLIPFTDAVEQFEKYLQVLLKSKEVNAELRTAIVPEISTHCNFMKAVQIICELSISPALYEKMIFDFAEMKMKLLSALKKNEDAFPLMKDYVTTVSTYIPSFKTSSSMDKVNTAEDVLLTTQDLWTSTGVYYIKKMIGGTGCQEAIKALDDYLHLQIPFVQSIPHARESVPTATVEVTATLDADSITSEMYSKAKNNVCWTLCLPPSALVYSGISKGSIIVHWKLPASWVDYVKSISPHAINVCKRLLLMDGIQEIRVGDDFTILCRAVSHVAILLMYKNVHSCVTYF